MVAPFLPLKEERVPELGLVFRLLFLFCREKDVESNIVKRKSKVFLFLVILSILTLLSGCAAFFIMRVLHLSLNKLPGEKEIEKYWKGGDYSEVYNLSKIVLKKKPFKTGALLFYGASCFYLAMGENDVSSSQDYLEEAIGAFRLSLYYAHAKEIPFISYMLGKSYFYKNGSSSFYYSDMAIKYLEKAKKLGYKANEMNEYLGLSYALLSLHDESVRTLEEDVNAKTSPVILYTLAEELYKGGKSSSAKQYLKRVKKESRDESLVIEAMNLLGRIYFEEGNSEGAKDEFESILKKTETFADAFYNLGLVYEKEGNVITARALWRKTLKAAFNHKGAIEKLGG